MKICVIGSGYVGLVTGACLADLGNQVVCVDNDQERLALLKKGKIPFYEPGLAELVKKNHSAKRIGFTRDLIKAVLGAQVIFIAVGTPPRKNGEADISAVIEVAKKIARAFKQEKGRKTEDCRIIVNKSTVPVGMGDVVTKILLSCGVERERFEVVSNPEFLREGTAIHDFMNPDRIVIGAETNRAFNTITELYRVLNAHIIFTTIKSAELIKYASNTFLATKISFINEIANICERVGADVTEVAHAIGLDKRIGREFLNAGVGYGGSCLPKDISALHALAKSNDYDPVILRAVTQVNKQQLVHFFNKIKNKLGTVKNKRIAILGLSFKPDTDDLRDAPSLKLIKMLAAGGARLTVHDPSLSFNIKMPRLKGVNYALSVYQALAGADALVLLTEWKEFKEIDFILAKTKMRGNHVFDGRNMLNARRVREAGLEYHGVGKGSHAGSSEA